MAAVRQVVLADSLDGAAIRHRLTPPTRPLERHRKVEQQPRAQWHPACGTLPYHLGRGVEQVAHRPAQPLLPMAGRQLMRRLLVLLVVLVVTISLGLPTGADSTTEADFLTRINASRSANDLTSLSIDGALQSFARVHTQDMMDSNSIYHSTSAELQAAGGAGWSRLGENVGRGGSADSLHAAFMDSAGHRANILGDYNYVGIGTNTLEDVLYVTVVFMKKNEVTTTTSVSATTTPTTTPSTTTTTTRVTSTSLATPDESCS